MTMNAGGEERPRQNLLAGYPLAAAAFDEMLAPDGSVREHWRTFMGEMERKPLEVHNARAVRLERLVSEYGIAHDVFADVTHATEPWRVDLMPLMIAPAEWTWLQRALEQRARLFNAVLGDIYGARHLLQSGRIPPALVFSDPNFLRPCSGIEPPGGHICFYAIDLARGPDGAWRAIDNHTETLAGSGFALANRIVCAHIARETMHDANVYKLAPYFERLHEEILRRVRADDPLIAMLTPGPLHDDFFGHSYLARYLGLTLVEGGDLRVIGKRVFMKTLEGLRPISLLLRSVQGAQADPLELDPSGFLGPVGLVQNARETPGFVINPLGSALAENRGLAPYLPDLCRFMLGEDLLLPDAPRAWLGDADARARVLGDLDSYIIRTTHEGTGRPGQARPGLSAREMEPQERARLIERINLYGKTLVGEPRLGLASAPVWTPEGPRPMPYAMRMFVAAIDGRFEVMPGGLALSIQNSDSVALSAPEGLSRDVWVQSEGQVPPSPTLMRQVNEVAVVQRTGRGLRSRIADNLFWLGRYAERSDWTLRLLRVALSRLDEDGSPARDHGAMRDVLNTMLSKGQPRLQIPADASARAVVERLVRTLAASPGYPYGLRQSLENVHRLSSLIRDRLSLEAWRTLQKFGPTSELFAPSLPGSLSDAQDMFDRNINMLSAFNGLVAENMTRDHGWRFLDMGRRVERASNSAEMLASLFASVRNDGDEAAALLFTLDVADSVITFRSRYLFAPVLPLVLDLLLKDEVNPRGIAFQLARLSGHLKELPQASEGSVQTDEERMILDMLTQVQLADVNEISDIDGTGARPQLKLLLNKLVQDLPRLSEAITRRYFNLQEDELKRVFSSIGPKR